MQIFYFIGKKSIRTQILKKPFRIENSIRVSIIGCNVLHFSIFILTFIASRINIWCANKIYKGEKNGKYIKKYKC